MTSHVTAQGVAPPRLVTVTQREPFRVVEREGGLVVEKSTGGLIAALEPAMREMNGLWISERPQVGLDDARLSEAIAALPYAWRSVALDEATAEGFYLGFSNGALWPLYHSMLGDAAYHRHHWRAYRAANERFVDVVAGAMRDDDIVWVHDYQLSLVPGLLRAQGMGARARIGFFLHIPFPPVDLFRTLPWGQQILEGMLGASIIGFHVAEYAQNFMECVETILGLRCDRLRGRITIGDRFVNVRAIPISIDTRRIHDEVAKSDVQARAAALRRDVTGEKLIVGVDRLDYTKGILDRLRALETFFERYPHRRGEVSMVQVAVPSRTGLGTYQSLREDIERQVGHINGLFARPGWTPVTYMFRSLPFDELVALYLAADVGLVTPLRDGMNLVAKEYVAAHVAAPGVLVLSELAGAAQQLTEALLVNPYDVDAIADAVEQALSMPREQQARRMRTLNAKIARFDVAHWVSSFLDEIQYTE